MPAPVQLALARRWPQLAERAELTDDAAIRLWESGLDAADAMALVRRELPKSLCAQIAANERRQTVLEVFAAHNWSRLDESAKAKVISRVRGSAARNVLAIAEPIWQAALVGRLDGTGRIAWLSEQPEIVVSDEDLIIYLDGLATWLDPKGVKTGRQVRATALEVLAHFRPVALPLLVAQCPASALSAIAGALSLHDPDLQAVLVARIVAEDQPWAAMALVANPVATETTVEAIKAFVDAQRHPELHRLVDQVTTNRAAGKLRPQGPVLAETDRTILGALVRRAQPYRWRADGRPVQLAYLMGSEHLGAELVDTLLAEFRTVIEFVPTWRFAEQLENLAAILSTENPLLLTTARRWIEPRPDYEEARRSEIVERITAEQADPDWVAPWRTLSLEQSNWDWLTDEEVTHFLTGIDAALGDDPATWELLCSMLDRHVGCLNDLVQVARATTD